MINNIDREHNNRVKNEILNNKFMRVARKAMFKAQHNIQIGAVIVVGNKINAEGYNYFNKTHPLIERHYPAFAKSIHAELNALIKYNKKRFGKNINASAYVYRENKHGFVRSAKPCQTCQELMKEAGIRRVFYSTENGINMEVL